MKANELLLAFGNFIIFLLLLPCFIATLYFGCFFLGQLIWAAIAAYELCVYSIEGYATVTSVHTFPIWPESGGTWGTTYTFQGHNRILLSPEPLAEEGEIITVLYLKDHPNIFAPVENEVSYFDMLSFLGSIGFKKGAWTLIVLHLMFGSIAINAAFVCLKFIIIKAIPTLSFISNRFDNFLFILVESLQIKAKIKSLRNIIFILLFYSVICLLIIETGKFLYNTYFHDNTTGPVVSGFYFTFGFATFLLMFYFASIYRREQFFPNLLALIRELFMIITLIGIFIISIYEWKAIIYGEPTNLYSLLDKVWRILFIE